MFVNTSNPIERLHVIILTRGANSTERDGYGKVVLELPHMFTWPYCKRIWLSEFHKNKIYDEKIETINRRLHWNGTSIVCSNWIY